MPNRPDPDSFGFLVSDLARLLRAEFDRRIAEAGIGLTAGEARTLSHVQRAGSARQSVLAERMGVEAMTLCGFVDRLEARQLVSRRVDPSDRRAKIIELTDQAKDVLLQISLIASAMNNDLAANVSDADWSVVVSGVRQARNHMLKGRETDPNGGSAA